jgi:hypothetical protein
VHFSYQEREQKAKTKKSITGGNPIIISLHASHHVKESTAVHLRRRRIAKFGHRAASLAPLEWRGCRPLSGAYGIVF